MTAAIQRLIDLILTTPYLVIPLILILSFYSTITTFIILYAIWKGMPRQ